ncbi:DeoR/GlpR family DNA-binding transcription regulator [Croceitalea sp. MTPC9]|uniref:DeoR/GlpR family DNA-binding transcription regulator n=1 Tax=unclassified Croceitalea TaxID=2632280 RepID=UPI002B3FAA65|nr:DeoR/GlpR family DNA-binding transcription regulator [Croceitalea sp. MTPC6]GMN15277.1 DeoR/GlpR family DNA-binding transcription regulator [Croceitalea sp. MTPC9]
MLKEERHQIILNEVRVHNRILLTDIANLLDVSADTIRRDIKSLDNQKKLKKVHGGAVSLGFNNYNPTIEDIYALSEKKMIAKKAIQLLKDGQVILLTGGTTNIEIAKLIPARLKLTCFTPSLQVAIQMLNKPDIETVFIGGKLSNNSQITIGGNAINMLSQIKTDICFLGTNSISCIDGLSEFDWDIVQVKRAMIRTSSKVVSPSISEKLDSTQRYKICEIEAIDILITELEPSNSLLKPYADRGLSIL